MYARCSMMGILAAAVLQPVVATCAEQNWRPAKQVEVVIPSGPGGSLDRTGRTVQSLFQSKKYVDLSVVVNRPGAGGGLALNYVLQRVGDPHYLAIGSSSMVASHLTGGNPYSYLELTPIALLLNDYVAFAVPADSPLKNGRDIIARLRTDPAALTVAIGTSLGGSAHIAFGHAMKRAGIDVQKLRVVAFKSGSEALASVLGGHVDVLASSPGNIVPQAASGKLRAIAVSSPRRMGGELASVPTWKELGSDSTYDNWRGIASAKDIGTSQVAYWDSVFAQLVKTPEWHAELRRNYWGSDYLDSAAFSKFLKTEFDELRTLLTELSLMKK